MPMVAVSDDEMILKISQYEVLMREARMLQDMIKSTQIITETSATPTLENSDMERRAFCIQQAASLLALPSITPMNVSSVGNAIVEIADTLYTFLTANDGCAKTAHVQK